ncbi:MAG TPA: RNA polymerase sigma factor RpoD/SigA [Gemmatimonadaceae bacterium]|nr:RNA polymerase sigma factor RpoD/SigA [Gemmatimonadaceae bacterium]
MPKTSRRAKTVRRARIENTAPKDLLDLYIDELSRTPMLKAPAQKALARRMRDPALGDDERRAAREELIQANLRFAFSVAKQYQNRGLPLEDLVSEANAGLCRAADKYDPDVGVNFISYAVWWIRQALFAAITTKARAVRLPLNRAGDVTRLSKAQATLRETLGREPTREEVAQVAGLSTEIAESLLALTHPERSLDEPLGSGARGGDRRTLGNVMPRDPDHAFDELPAALEKESRREALRRALAPLPARDQKILILYYGLDTGEPMTLGAIAGMLGITRERVRQLRDRALTRVRSGDMAELLRHEWAA